MEEWIAAFVVGFVVGGLGERWLLWRRLLNDAWIERRMEWRGVEARRASVWAGEFAAMAEVVRFNPLQAGLWLVHCHRRIVVGVLTGVLVGVLIAVAR